MAGRVTARRPMLAIDGSETRSTRDILAVEEPMEIRLDGAPVAVTMRTPGDDFALALGFCCTEGLVDDPADVASIRYCAGKDPQTGENTFNVVEVTRHRPARVPDELRREVYTTSSCGICGTRSIDLVRRRLAGVEGDATSVSVEALRALPDRLRGAQALFDRTGGLHAAALFTAGGTLVDIREDVGRHNAVDKLLGRIAMEGEVTGSGHVLMVSGRVAFEIAQKALWARVPVVAAVSAPTSLAVEFAAEAGMTLVGFLRGERMNVYAGAQRISNAVDDAHGSEDR